MLSLVGVTHLTRKRIKDRFGCCRSLALSPPFSFHQTLFSTNPLIYQDYLSSVFSHKEELDMLVSDDDIQTKDICATNICLQSCQDEVSGPTVVRKQNYRETLENVSEYTSFSFYFLEMLAV